MTREWPWQCYIDELLDETDVPLRSRHLDLIIDGCYQSFQPQPTQMGRWVNSQFYPQTHTWPCTQLKWKNASHLGSHLSTRNTWQEKQILVTQEHEAITARKIYLQWADSINANMMSWSSMSPELISISRTPNNIGITVSRLGTVYILPAWGHHIHMSKQAR